MRIVDYGNADDSKSGNLATISEDKDAPLTQLRGRTSRENNHPAAYGPSVVSSASSVTLQPYERQSPRRQNDDSHSSSRLNISRPIHTSTSYASSLGARSNTSHHEGLGETSGGNAGSGSSRQTGHVKPSASDNSLGYRRGRHVEHMKLRNSPTKDRVLIEEDMPTPSSSHYI